MERRYRLAILLLLTAALYAPSLHFGFLWDDPIWFRRVLGKSWWQLFAPMPDNQFYRPGTLLIIRLFARPDGTFPIVGMHAFQIALHLLSTLLVERLARLLRADESLAWLTAIFFAFFPLGAQAIVWAAPQQPWVLALMLLLLNLYPGMVQRGSGWHRWAWGGLFLFAMMVQESAVQMLPLLLLLDARRSSWRDALRRPALWGYVMTAALYLALWFAMPKHHGETGVSFEGGVALYLLQAPVWPFLGRVSGVPLWMEHALPWLEAGGILLLSSILALRRRDFFLFWGGGWFAAQLFSSWAGLRAAYVFLSPRLFYLAAPGIALMWAACLAPRPQVKGVRRWLPLLLAVYLILQGGRLIWRQEQDYQLGVPPLREAIRRLCTDEEGRRYLFVNFPDRYRERRPLLPLGYWGVTLAPIHVPLGDFAAITCGRRPETTSLSVPALDLEAREVLSWQVDMRGSPVDLVAIYRAAHDGAWLYVARYGSDRIELRKAGRLRRFARTSQPLARFGERVALLAADFDDDGLYLRWQAITPPPPEIVAFVHLFDGEGQLIAQADGAPAASLLPFRLLRRGEIVEEWRPLLDQGGGGLPAGRYVLEVGLYNWQTGERLPALAPDGTPFPQAAYRMTFELSAER